MGKASTAVATQDPDIDATDLAELEAAEAELVRQNQADSDPADLQIPILKVGQALTKEVQDGDANQGEFINTLTREGLGDTVEFIVAGVSKGRFYHGDRKKGIKARKAFNATFVPWEDSPFFGKPFSEHPDAEESYSARVNAKEIEWGSGPPISTTYDFTGYVLPEEGEQPIPVCLSLMRGDSKAARNWLTILNAVMGGKYWDAVFVLSTERKQSDGNNYYGVTVKRSRKTTTAEKAVALGFAKAVRQQATQFVGDDPEAPAAAPAANGGMEV